MVKDTQIICWQETPNCFSVFGHVAVLGLKRLSNLQHLCLILFCLIETFASGFDQQSLNKAFENHVFSAGYFCKSTRFMVIKDF